MGSSTSPPYKVNGQLGWIPFRFQGRHSEKL